MHTLRDVHVKYIKQTDKANCRRPFCHLETSIPHHSSDVNFIAYVFRRFGIKTIECCCSIALSQTFYPINKLRNVAVKNSHATHVLLIDIDFVPNRGLESAVTDYIDAGFFDDTYNISARVRNIIC